MTAAASLSLALALREPAWLALVPLVLAAAVVRARAPAPGVRFSPAALWLAGGGPQAGTSSPGAGSVPAGSEPLPRSWRVRWLSLPRALEAFGLLLAVVALARPSARVPVPVTTEGVDVVLCLDVSSSMDARDLDPARSRLEVAKDAARAFVDARPSDRIGLVTFARFPDLACPPTLDHEALRRILSGVAVVPSESDEDATGIGTAVARAAQVLSASSARSRVVVLLTDGEENVATADEPGEIAPAHAAQLCERLGVRVHAIAAGTGRRLPGGAVVRPDVAALSRLAKRTGGAFSEARDAAAVASVYARVDALERSPFVEAKSTLEDRFLPFVVTALALLLLGRLLAATVLGTLP